jgi:pyruvate/2-oxoacid:ferredoxin oxidoreductase alpha subunit
MGTIGATAEQVVDDLRKKGEQVGSLRIRMFRPFPAESVGRILSRAGHVAVIDRDISLGFGGILWGEIKGLTGSKALVQNFIAGIGGGDVRPEHIKDIITRLRQQRVATEPVIMEGLQ